MKHFCHSLDYTVEWGNSPAPPPHTPHIIKKGQVCIMTLHHSISSNISSLINTAFLITQQIKLTAGKSLFDCWSLQKDSLCYYRWWCRALCPQMSVDILGTSCDQCWSTVQCCFTSTETVKLIRTESPGWPPRLSHNSWKCYYRLICCTWAEKQFVFLKVWSNC